MPMDMAEQLARRWMPKPREGSAKRPGWEHPQDIVTVLASIPRDWSPATHQLMEQIAWLHDILEDGRKHDSTPVTANDLKATGLTPAVISGVDLLTRHPPDDFDTYIQRLTAANRPELLVIKCCDRLANLREAKGVFSAPRMQGYIAETHEQILPLLDRLPHTWQSATWLRHALEAAVG